MQGLQTNIASPDWSPFCPLYSPLCLPSPPLRSPPHSGRCGPNASAPQPGCSDVPTPDSYTCQQQKGEQAAHMLAVRASRRRGRAGVFWGGAAAGSGWQQLAPVVPFRPRIQAPIPFPPLPRADWGKCDQSFIKDNGYCKATCGACSGGQPEVQAYNGPSDSSPSPSPSPSPGGRRLSAGGRRLLR